MMAASSRASLACFALSWRAIQPGGGLESMFAESE
jgi:hypothetical protein